MKTVQLTFQKINGVDGEWYDSNMIQLNGSAGVHIEMPGTGNYIAIYRSITGMNPVSCYHDYFAEIFDKDLLHIDIGQKYVSHFSTIGAVVKFRMKSIPNYACVKGEVEDLGPVNPDDPGDILNGFAGSEGVYFQDIESEYLIGRSRSLNLNPNY